MRFIDRYFGRKVVAIVPVPELSVQVPGDTPLIGGKLEDRVLQAYREAGPMGMTADECATRLGLGLLSVRPTVTRLYQMQELDRTGEKRLNHSGIKANVLAHYNY